jgi:hypothetical protein
MPQLLVPKPYLRSLTSATTLGLLAGSLDRATASHEQAREQTQDRADFSMLESSVAPFTQPSFLQTDSGGVVKGGYSTTKVSTGVPEKLQISMKDKVGHRGSWNGFSNGTDPALGVGAEAEFQNQPSQSCQDREAPHDSTPMQPASWRDGLCRHIRDHRNPIATPSIEANLTTPERRHECTLGMSLQSILGAQATMMQGIETTAHRTTSPKLLGSGSSLQLLQKLQPKQKQHKKPDSSRLNLQHAHQQQQLLMKQRQQRQKLTFQLLQKATATTAACLPTVWWTEEMLDLTSSELDTLLGTAGLSLILLGQLAVAHQQNQTQKIAQRSRDQRRRSTGDFVRAPHEEQYSRRMSTAHHVEQDLRFERPQSHRQPATRTQSNALW